jgi:hypothetical protein
VNDTDDALGLINNGEDAPDDGEVLGSKKTGSCPGEDGLLIDEEKNLGSVNGGECMLGLVEGTFLSVGSPILTLSGKTSSSLSDRLITSETSCCFPDAPKSCV